MHKCIYVDTLKDAVEDWFGDDYGFVVKDINYIVDDMPAADVEPVRHEKWTVQECYSDTYIICPECGFSIKVGAPHRFKWCPGCGAKMDGGSEE